MKKDSLWWPKLIFAGNLLIILFFWYNGSPINNNTDTIDILMSIGRLSGLLLTYFLLIQLILISRLKIIENVLGHDKLTRWHRNFGISIGIFLLAHPLFLAFAYGLNNQINWLKQLYNFIFFFDDIGGAAIATLILILIILLSTKIIGRRWKYEKWYLSHLFAYLTIFMSFGHQLELGGDFSQKLFVIYWYLLFIGFLLLYAYSRFIKPLNNYRLHQFKVSRVIRETSDVCSVYITGRKIADFKFSGGQFGIFRFFNRDLFLEAHPFSFSNYQKGAELRISIKKLGDFTNSLDEKLKPGTPVFIEGPLGVFTMKPNINKYLLIAGGIGITPIRSLAEELTTNNKDVQILVSVKNKNEEIFDSEFSVLAQASNFKYFKFYSEESSETNESNVFSGRINFEKIKNLIPDWQSREIYLCGPEKMISSLNNDLISAGLNKTQIHFERFNV